MMAIDEMCVHRDLTYHGYPKTKAGLENYRRVLLEWTKKKPIKKHFGVPCGLLITEYKENKRILKMVEKKLKALRGSEDERRN